MITPLALFLSTQLVVAVADEVPKFDVAPTCRAESATTAATADSCIQDEQSARNQLSQEWAQFTARDKARCVALATDVAGIRSYVEVLTCLEMERDARKLPQ
jgi:hypothetical protein